MDPRQKVPDGGLFEPGPPPFIEGVIAESRGQIYTLHRAPSSWASRHRRGSSLGSCISAEELAEARWPLARRPYLTETSIPGVFAVGDVRSSSVKRVASAVGEGPTCVQLAHRALHEL